MLLLLLDVEAPLLGHVQQARDPYIVLGVAGYEVGALARLDQLRIAVRGPCEDPLVCGDRTSMRGGRLDHAVEDFCGRLTQLIGGVDVALAASFQWTLLMHIRGVHGRLNDKGRVGLDDPGGPLHLEPLNLAAQHPTSCCLLGAGWRHVQAGVLVAERVGRRVLVEVWPLLLGLIHAAIHGVGGLWPHIVRSLISLEELRRGTQTA